MFQALSFELSRATKHARERFDFGHVPVQAAIEGDGIAESGAHIFDQARRPAANVGVKTHGVVKDTVHGRSRLSVPRRQTFSLEGRGARKSPVEIFDFGNILYREETVAEKIRTMSHVCPLLIIPTTTHPQQGLVEISRTVEHAFQRTSV